MKKPRKRDRKAPRFRRSKFRFSVLNRELHKKYLESYPEGLKDYSVFKRIVEDFNALLCDYVIKNRDGVKLPAHMGILALCSFKPRRRVPMNFLGMDQTEDKLKALNLGTEGLVCKIAYSIYTSRYKAKSAHIWKFEACRLFKNKASSAFRKNHNIYKRLDNKSRMSKMFRNDYSRSHIIFKRHKQGMDSGQPNNG